MTGYILAGILVVLVVTFVVSCVVAGRGAHCRCREKAEVIMAISGVSAIAYAFVIGAFGIAYSVANPPKCKCGCKCEVKR